MLRSTHNSQPNNDAAGGGANNGNDPSINNHQNKISVDDLMRLLKRLFPTKTDNSFAKINKVLKSPSIFPFKHPSNIWIVGDHNGQSEQSIYQPERYSL